MSYRELRNFCEIMRALGYPRLISMENFRNPNFELVADILYWLAMRYDPQAEISDDIDEERNRVEFIKNIATLFASKTRIKLNTRKLYGADGYAVQEILKIATVLYKAYTSPPGDDDSSQGFQLPSKLSNLKAHKAIANEITEIGAKLFDSISKENELKVHRDKALAFLDNISQNLESNSEQQYIEKCVKEIIQQQDQNIQEMQKYVTNLERDQKTLEEKIKKKTIDVERSEKRLKLMTNMKPAFMEEYERYESDMEKIYQIYIEKFRNIDYLENQLDIFIKAEERKFEESQRKIIEMQTKISQEDIIQLRGDAEIDENQLEQQIANANSSRAASRSDSRGFQKQQKGDTQQQRQTKGTQQQGGSKQVQGNLEGPNEDEDESDMGGDDDGIDIEESGDGNQDGDSDNEF